MKRLVRTLLLVPIIMTPVVVGLTWRFIFDPATGMANYLLSRLGIDPVDWLGSPQVALFSVLIADIWQWTPFVILLSMAALDSAPTDPLDAARVDGAREWQVTWYVLLPMLRRAIAIVALIRAIDSIKAFDLFYIMTRGGPALSTETLNFYGYVVGLHQFRDFLLDHGRPHPDHLHQCGAALPCTACSSRNRGERDDAQNASSMSDCSSCSWRCCFRSTGWWSPPSR